MGDGISVSSRGADFSAIAKTCLKPFARHGLYISAEGSTRIMRGAFAILVMHIGMTHQPTLGLAPVEVLDAFSHFRCVYGRRVITQSKRRRSFELLAGRPNSLISALAGHLAHGNGLGLWTTIQKESHARTRLRLPCWYSTCHLGFPQWDRKDSRHV